MNLPAAWQGAPVAARVAAVQRSLIWALDQPDGGAHAPCLGAASLRLFDEAAELAGGAIDPADDRIADARAALALVDAVAVRDRPRALQRALRSLARIQPPALPPAPPAGPLDADAPPLGVGDGGVDERRRRRPREDRGREPQDERSAAERPPEARPREGRPRDGRPREGRDDRVRGGPRAAPAPAPALAEAPAAEEPRTREPREPRRRDRPREPREGREPVEPSAAPPEPVPEPPRPEPTPPARLPLGWPEGSGRPVGALGLATADEIAALDASGIETIADLLLQVPAGHLRPARLEGEGVALPGEAALVRGVVLARCLRLGPAGRRFELLLGGAGDAPARCRWHSQPPEGWETWALGAELGFVGLADEGAEGVVLYEAEPVGLDGRGSGLLPEYRIEGLSEERARAIMRAALRSIEGVLEDPLPVDLLEAHRLLHLEEALRDAHFPANTTGRGQVRLAFEELLLLQLGVAWRAGKGRGERGPGHKALHELVGDLAWQHSVSLDDSQELAFSDVRRDLRRTRPMARLLQGDVGTGKGLVAQMAALVVAANGAQVAMVFPDALAAERRFLHVEAQLRSIGVAAVCVGDGPDRAQADALRRGEARIVYGTRALLAPDLEWRRLGLVVVEERGPYGTVTPGSLKTRGPRPDLLVVTRAPIPSSLAFTVFGDFDVSMLHLDDPPRVRAQVLPFDARAEAYAQLRDAVRKGRQGFVVFPVRDGRDLLSTEDAVQLGAALQADLLQGCRIGVYCSDMAREDRSRVFDEFLQRRVDVLICTTYIEDTPPVANASAMVVEYADLHDAIRLHRLRAHIGRSGVTPACAWVMSDSPNERSRELLERVAAEMDGFRLAELDLQERGGRAILGDRAAEMPEFQWADPARDRELLLRARAAAFQIVAVDPELRESPTLADAVSIRWGDWLGQSVPAGQRRRVDRRRRRRRRRR